MNEQDNPDFESARRLRELREASIIFDKQTRVDIDALVQRLKGAPKSAERTLAYRALQTAKHWLGEDLAILGVTNPYPNGKDPSNTIVDPAADVARPPRRVPC